MNLARLPLIPTVLVAAAAATMVGLGFWQLDRREEKSALLARYAAAASDDSVVRWDAVQENVPDFLYRRARLDCERVDMTSAIAGQNEAGQSGLAITAQCATPAGGTGMVVLGWSQAPVTPDWQGGRVEGVIAPGPRLVADPPVAGLAANAIPDPSEIPDNHLAYAVQWFFFAATALVIYGLAVRKRLAGEGGGR